jgi:hypothetical protein
MAALNAIWAAPYKGAARIITIWASTGVFAAVSRKSKSGK